MTPLIFFMAFSSTSPACDAPEVRSALVKEWSRMASAKSDTLAGSEVRVWSLRPDGKKGDCLADFLARRPGASVGGTIPFHIEGSGKGFRLQTRGEPRLNLLQADSGVAR